MSGECPRCGEHTLECTCKGYFAIGADELAQAEPAEEFADCPQCHQKHEVTQYPSKTGSICLGVYKCGDAAYLYSINGKKVIGCAD